MLRKLNYANVMSTLAAIAAVAALTMGGAIAAGKITITSKDIKNGTVKTQDIAKNAVQAPDIKNGAVRSADIANETIDSADIGTGEVKPQDVTMPPPDQVQQSAEHSVPVGTDYERVSTYGSYHKTDAASALNVDWTGSAGTGFAGCVFQLRIGGQTAAGGGEVFVANSQTMSVSVSALFEGMAVGDHQIEIWAKTPNSNGAKYPCTVGPTSAAVSQTFVVTEQIS